MDQSIRPWLEFEEKHESTYPYSTVGKLLSNYFVCMEGYNAIIIFLFHPSIHPSIIFTEPLHELEGGYLKSGTTPLMSERAGKPLYLATLYHKVPPVSHHPNPFGTLAPAPYRSALLHRDEEIYLYRVVSVWYMNKSDRFDSFSWRWVVITVLLYSYERIWRSALERRYAWHGFEKQHSKHSTAWRKISTGLPATGPHPTSLPFHSTPPDPTVPWTRWLIWFDFDARWTRCSIVSCVYFVPTTVLRLMLLTCCADLCLLEGFQSVGWFVVCGSLCHWWYCTRIQRSGYAENVLSTCFNGDKILGDSFAIERFGFLTARH